MFRSDTGGVGTSSIRPVVVGNTTGPLVVRGYVNVVGPLTAGTASKPLVLQGSTIESGTFGISSAPLAIRGSSVAIENPVLGSAKLQGTSLAMETTPGYDIVVVMGQSNSCGASAETQGTTVGTKVLGINPFYDTCDPRISILPKTDTTYVIPANEPTGGQAPGDGRVGFPLSFCTQCIQHVPQNRKILIVHGGFGDTTFDGTTTGSISGSYGTLSWTSTDSNNLYTRVRDRTIAAVAAKYDSPRDVNRVVAFLWHQGESNIALGMAADVYYNRLATLIRNIRTATATPTTPFITGGFVSQWISSGSQPVLSVLKGLSDPTSPYYVTNCGYADSQAVPVPPFDPSNAINFSTEGYRLMGIRYYNGYRAATRNTRPITFTALSATIGSYDLLADAYSYTVTWTSYATSAMEVYTSQSADGPFTLAQTVVGTSPPINLTAAVSNAPSTLYIRVIAKNDAQPPLTRTIPLVVPAVELKSAGLYNVRPPFNTFAINAQTYTVPTMNYTAAALLSAMTTASGGLSFSLDAQNRIVRTPPLLSQISSVAKDSAASVFSLRAVNILRNPGVFVTSPVVQWPPIFMTSNMSVISGQAYGNGTYTTVASSFNGADFAAWRPFSGTSWWRPITSDYTGGVYTGTAQVTVSDGVNYYGDWIQIQLPNSIRLVRYTLDGNQPFGLSIPMKFYVFGSNNLGVTWTMIDSRDIPEYVTREFVVPNSAASYNWLRLSVNKIPSYSTTVRLTKWIIQGSSDSVPFLPTGVYTDRLGDGTSVKAVQVRPVAEFPPTGFTSAATNPGGNQYNQTLSGYPFGGSGVYTANASSWQEGIPWGAFDNSTSGWWETSFSEVFNNTGAGGANMYYSGAVTTTVSGSSVSGPWLQLGVPTAIVLTSYSMSARKLVNVGRMPYQFVIAGSIDGTNWETVDARNGINTWTFPTPITFTTTSTTAYLYFRLIVQAIMGNGTANQDVNIGQWTLYGTIIGTNTDFYTDRTGNLLTAPVPEAWRPVVQWPPIALTSNVTSAASRTYGNGTYTVSASIIQTQFEFAKEWNIFDRGTSTHYEGNGTHYGPQYLYSNTTTISTVSVLGEWVQIQLPTTMTLRRYFLLGRSGFYTRVPSTFWIAGSNDGSTWSNVHSQSGLSYGAAGITIEVPQTSNAVPYSYYRLVTGVLNGGDKINLATWELYGDSASYTNPAVSLSTWLGGATGYVSTWYDQSGQGQHLAQTESSLQPTISLATTPASIVFTGIGTTSGQYFQNTIPFTFNFGTNHKYGIRAVVNNTVGGCLIYKGIAGFTWTTGAKKWWLGTSTNNEVNVGAYPNLVGNSEGYVIGQSAITSSKTSVTWSSSAFNSIAVYTNASPISVNYINRQIITDPGSFLYIGAGGGSSYYNGNIYEIEIFSSTLGAADVTIMG